MSATVANDLLHGDRITISTIRLYVYPIIYGGLGMKTTALKSPRNTRVPFIR
jgi:hypothetical protein